MKNSINLSKKSLIFATAVLFLTAVLTGFISESKALQNSDLVTRRALITEMARVQKVLKPVLKNTDKVRDLFFPSDDLPEEIESVVSAGIIKSLPNGTWRMNEVISRGEGLYYLGKLMNQTMDDMQRKPVLIECEHQFKDISPQHWLNQTLKKLAGTGGLQFYKETSLFPDANMTKSELKAISAQLINYFGSNMIISIFDGKNLYVKTKGALRDIQLVGWKYTLDGENWEKLNSDGMITLKASPSSVFKISFRHPIFLESRQIILEMGLPSLNLIKLKRNYANFTKDSFAGRVPVNSGYTSNARIRLKEKLAEIKRKRLAKAPYSAPVKTVQHENRRKRFSVPIYSRKDSTQCSDNNNSSEILKSEIPEDNLRPKSLPSQKEAMPTSFQNEETTEKKSEIAETTEASEPRVFERKLSGKVINSITGEPINGAIVVFSGKNLITNEKGEFFYSGKHNQAFEITTYCEGYRPLRLKHRIRYRKEPLTISLKPLLLKFSGRVVSLNSGIPVAKATIKIGDSSLKSEIDGTFAFTGLKPGYHQLSCFAEGFLDAHEIVYISKDEENANFNLELKAMYDENIYFTESEISEVEPEEILRRANPALNQAKWILKE